MKKKLFTLVVVLFVCYNVSAQSGLYAPDTIQKIEITFPFSNWDYRMDTAKYGEDDYTVATEVKINGIVFASAGVRYKGNSSYDSTQQKNPIHVKLSFVYENAEYNGYTDIKLSNGFDDPSGVREVLAYKVLRNYMDAPLSNFAKVYINGIYYGVYSNDENIDEDFLDRHFYSSDRTFVKGNPESVINGHIPSLVYLGTDSSLYYDRYELKSDYAWKDVVDLCNTITNNPTQLDSVLDIDRALWMLAFNDVTVNLDSYSGQFAQNYYLYRDHNNRIVPIIWDLNMCFGSFKNTGSANLNLSTMQQLTPLLHATNAARPLIKTLLADSTYKRMYLAHAKTINDEFFLNGNYQSLAQSFQTLIDTSVQAESFSLFTYPEFQNGLTTTAAGIPGINELMVARATYLNTTTEFQNTQPAISNIIVTPVQPAFGSTINITTQVLNGTKVYFGYRNQKADRFRRIEMFDNGLHVDGSSGDNIYGVAFTISSLNVQYYIYAENSNAGKFTPERAEHEFYTIHPSITMATASDIVINEFMPYNKTGITNESGKRKDWIEIYNTTNNALGLEGFYLSDELQNLHKWSFPDDAFIPAKGFLLIWADDKDSTMIELHTNFNLSETGDSIFLTNQSFQFSDSITYGNTSIDISYARCPDGSGAFATTNTPTPRSSNCVNFVSSVTSNQNIFIYPNPATDYFIIENNIGNKNIIEIRNTQGQLIISKEIKDQQPIEITDLTSGIYFVSVIQNDGLIYYNKLVKL